MQLKVFLRAVFIHLKDSLISFYNFHFIIFIQVKVHTNMFFNLTCLKLKKKLILVTK